MILWIFVFIAIVFFSFVALMVLSSLSGSGTDIILLFIALQLCFVSTLIFYVMSKTNKVEQQLQSLERKMDEQMNNQGKDE